MNEKLLRTVLMLVGVAALGMFAFKMVDFVKNRAKYQDKLSAGELTEMRREFRQSDTQVASGSHLLDYSEYEVIQRLNITGYVKPLEVGPITAPVEAPGINARDLEVPFIQFPNAAWIQPAGAQSDPNSEVLPGDLYVVGDVFELETRRGAKLRLDKVEVDKVTLVVVDTGKELIVRTGDMPINMKELLGSGVAEGAPPVAQRPPPERTEKDETGVYRVGTKDLDDLGELTEEELLSSAAVDVDRDRLTNEPRGLLLRRINNPILTRMGLEQNDVVLEVNGEAALSRDDLVRRMRDYDGDSITVVVERLGGKRTLTYRLPRK